MKLTRRKLAALVAEESGFSKRTAYELVGEVLERISEALSEGAVVELRNFGVFEVFERKAREIHVPGRGQIKVAKRLDVGFRPGKALREGLEGRKKR